LAITTTSTLAKKNHVGVAAVAPARSLDGQLQRQPGAAELQGGVSWPGSTVNVTGGGDSAFLRRGAAAAAAAAPRERTTTFSNYRRFAESLSSRLYVTLRRLGFVLAIFWRYVNLYVCMHVWRLQCLRCFDAVGWAAGRASGL